MKPICVLGFCLFIFTGAIAQGNQKDQKLKDHEKIIWAGTGIDLNEKAKDAKHAPNAVISAFRQLFPEQPLDNVRKYRGLYALTFSNAVFTTTFLYKADGTFVEARTVATESSVPGMIREKVVQSKWDYATNDVVIIEKPNKQKIYRLHLKRNNKVEYVHFNEEGGEVVHDY